MEPVIYYQLPARELKLEGNILDFGRTVAAEVLDASNTAIINAVLDVSKINGITDLYILDEKFVLDALREKMEREQDQKDEKPKRLTVEELQQMPGEPVWVEDIRAWAIVTIPVDGCRRPYVTGFRSGAYTFSFAAEQMACFRHNPKEVE